MYWSNGSSGRSASQTDRPIVPPGRSTRSISAAAAGRSVKNGMPCWHRTTSKLLSSSGSAVTDASKYSIGALPAGTIVWSATSSPGGMQVAAVARPRDAESPSALVVIEPRSGRRDVRPLADGSEGVPPAWVGPGRVAIMERDRFDQPFLALITAATGRVTDRLAFRALAFGTSGDARSAVVVESDRIVVGPTASVLGTRRAPDAGPTMRAGDVVRGGVALSADGSFLAAAIEEGNPGPSRIAVYENTGGAWHDVVRVQPPISASGGWLAWLP